MNFSREAHDLYKALNKGQLTHAMLTSASSVVRMELAQIIRVAGGGINPSAALKASMTEFLAEKRREVAHGRA